MILKVYFVVSGRPNSCTAMYFGSLAEARATPVGVVDSNPTGSNNTDATGEGRQRGFVVQATTSTEDEEDFWGNPRVRTTGSTPAKRGW